MTAQREDKPLPLHEGADYAEPCVSVLKMREFGPNERFDHYCVKHHHWLNGAPAKSVVQNMIEELK